MSSEVPGHLSSSSMGIARDLEGRLVDLECPVCGFGLEVLVVDVICQVWRFCPCCRVRIRLMDGSGEVHVAMDEVEAAMGSLLRTFR